MRYIIPTFLHLSRFLPTCLINVNYIIVPQNLTYVTSNTNGSYRELPEGAVLRVARDRFSYSSLVCWTETFWQEADAIRERAYDNVSWTCMGGGDISQIPWEFHVE